MMNKTFALVDCNNFYCSCERLFRPDLKKVPVAVLSNNDGCIIARSQEVKALGIKMGTPREGQEQYPLFESPADTDTSDRLMRTIDRINQRTGKIWFGGQRPKKDWFMKQELRSPAYTTRWGSLPVVQL